MQFHGGISTINLIFYAWLWVVVSFVNSETFQQYPPKDLYIDKSKYLVDNKAECVVSQPESCHQSIGSLGLGYLSSKRPYSFDNGPVHQYVPSGCTPAKLWYFGRHGTRNPGKSDILDMQTVIPALFAEINVAINKSESQLCLETVTKFQSWKPREDLTPDEESILVEQGKQELYSISSRYLSRFPSLYNPKFNNETYFFKFTNSERTEASAKSFAEGIFGPEGVDQVWFPQPQEADPILKFYDACPKWTEEVNKAPAGEVEVNKFKTSIEMNRTVARVSERIGIGRNLTLQELVIMYTTCAFETAWANGTQSSWCALFDLEDFKVMAYHEDLDYFWKDGYGFEINYKQACSPFQDAVNFFQSHVDNSTNDQRKVQAYFSHSGANLKMLARLGLFNNSVEITSDNFQQTKDTYLWRTSLIDTMASNMALVLYSCPPSSGGHGESDYQVGFFFQEIPTRLPACGNNAFCAFEEFKSSFSEGCNLEEICRI